MKRMNHPHGQRGATLFIGLMFLLVLSLIAVVALQGTTLEMKMSANNAQQTTAFQAAESIRIMAGAVTDLNTFHRGMNNYTGKVAKWASTGSTGSISAGSGTAACAGAALNGLATSHLYDDDFTLNSTYSDTWHKLAGVFNGNTPTTTASSIAGNPGKLMCANVGCPSGATTCANPAAKAWATVYTIGTRPAAGFGLGASEATTGKGIPAGGANKWFEIRSQAQATTGAIGVTTAEFRHKIEP